MATKNDLTAAYVRSILDYYPETGVFTWRERPPEHFKTVQSSRRRNARFAGKTAGCICDDTVIIGIDGRLYRAHRLAWLYMTGEWPGEQIDHRDVTQSNNSLGNLREASNSENQRNRCLQRNNTSGLKGVSWHVHVRKWSSRITINKKRIHLGYFDIKHDAAAAYAKAAREHHGEFARIQ